MYANSSLGPVAMMAVGIGATAQGALDLTEGCILKAIQSLFLGMISTDVGGRLQGLGPLSQAELMKCTVGAGTEVVGMHGACMLANGVKQRSVADILKGSVLTTVGIAGTAFVCNLDSRIIVIAHQASVIILSSSFIVKLGLYDLTKRRYLMGLWKTLLGLVVIASGEYYAYKAYKIHTTTLSQTLSAERIAFLDSHRAEIEEIYESRVVAGNWSELGKGASKKVFAHPELPGMLIKIPNRFGKGFRGMTPEDDLRIHHANLESVRSLATSFDRVILPESYLYPTSKGLMIVEQRLIFDKYDDVPATSDKQKVVNQFKAFAQEAHLCDVYPHYNHNVGLLSQTTPLKIGVIDFDCRIPVFPFFMIVFGSIVALKKGVDPWTVIKTALLVACVGMIAIPGFRNL